MIIRRTDETPKEKLAKLEFELNQFQTGIKSQFWQTLCTKWKPLVDSATGQALSSNCTDRGFASGKANGLHYFLTYPEKHIERLVNEISMLRKVVEASK